jgi:sulfite reductase alpha subunit-like flavoprotein
MSVDQHRRILILYGSETGEAQDFADHIGRELYKIRLYTEVLPMDDYPVQQLPTESLLIFVVSTTGKGNVPTNMRNFWKFLLRKNLPASSLSQVRAALCGLGDSGYQEFNFAAKKLYRRLLQLSTSFLLQPAYGDDQSPLGSLIFIVFYNLNKLIHLTSNQDHSKY